MRAALDKLYAAALWLSAACLVTIGLMVGVQLAGRLIDGTLRLAGLEPIAARRSAGRAPAPGPPGQGRPGDAGRELSFYRVRLRPVIIAFTRFSPCSMLAKTTPATCRASEI